MSPISCWTRWRTAVSISKADWFEKFPNMRFILSHAGGFIPFAAYRIARACAPDGNTALGLERLNNKARTGTRHTTPPLAEFSAVSKAKVSFHVGDWIRTGEVDG